jgi:hypothetical protein
MSEVPLGSLEDRVARLEEELRQVKALLTQEKESRQPWWERIAGSRQGSQAFDAIVREMRKNRRADYEAAAQAAPAADSAAHPHRKKGQPGREG